MTWQRYNNALFIYWYPVSLFAVALAYCLAFYKILLYTKWDVISKDLFGYKIFSYYDENGKCAKNKLTCYTQNKEKEVAVI